MLVPVTARFVCSGVRRNCVVSTGRDATDFFVMSVLVLEFLAFVRSVHELHATVTPRRRRERDPGADYVIVRLHPQSPIGQVLVPAYESFTMWLFDYVATVPQENIWSKYRLHSIEQQWIRCHLVGGSEDQIRLDPVMHRSVLCLGCSQPLIMVAGLGLAHYFDWEQESVVCVVLSLSF